MRAWGLVLLVLLVGCRGKIVTTATLTGPGTAEARFMATGGKLVLWADTDAKWNGTKNSKPEFDYSIDVLSGGKSLGTVTCGTHGIGGTRVCGSSTSINNAHSADCEYKLDCALPSLPSGEIVLRVTGRKGPNVTAVSKMSINVRAE